MFHRNNEKEQEKLARGYEYVEKTFSAEYMGGHMMYPNKTDATVEIFAKHVDIRFGSIRKHVITIPTVSITNISIEDEKRITKTRVLLTGLVVGLLWKKKFRYTVIDYKEGNMNQSVVIDFHKSAEEAQQEIYKRMVASGAGLA
jgi:hypothetical protein